MTESTSYCTEYTPHKCIKILVEKQNFLMKVLTLHHRKNVAGKKTAELKSVISLLMVGTFSRFFLVMNLLNFRSSMCYWYKCPSGHWCNQITSSYSTSFSPRHRLYTFFLHVCISTLIHRFLSIHLIIAVWAAWLHDLICKYSKWNRYSFIRFYSFNIDHWIQHSEIMHSPICLCQSIKMVRISK